MNIFLLVVIVFLALNVYWLHAQVQALQTTINGLLKRTLTLEDENTKNKRMIRVASGEI